MPRLSSRLQRRVLAKVLESNRRLEKRYERALSGLMRQMHDEMTSALKPKLPLYARADAGPFGSTVDSILLKYVTNAPRTVGPLFEQHAQSVSSANAQAMRVIGIRPSDLRIGTVIATRRDENIRLVEKAYRSYAQDVRDIFEDHNTFGMRVEDIADLLLERGNVSESRAELIARDQTLKLNGAITQTRQENAGISRYTWSTSLDEAVRPEHAILEGQDFDWTSPPAPGHPGEDIQCRCVAIPIIDELEGI